MQHDNHDHHHDGAHDHHDHRMTDTDNSGKLGISIVLTTLTLVAEVIAGVLTGSLALLSDAAHVFMDIFALALSFGAIKLSKRKASERHSYGFHRMKVIAAFINGSSLVVIALEIFRESIARFLHPTDVLAGPMLIVAVIGLVVNMLVALVLGHHDHDDLNTRSAFFHVVGDALSSVGVIIAGVVMLLTGWNRIDALISALIGVVLLFGAWNVLKEAVHILNEGTPDSVDALKLSGELANIEGVRSVHDLHVWSVSPGFEVLTAHAVLDDRLISETQSVMDKMKTVLAHEYDIRHTTIQIECESCKQCEEETKGE